MDPSKNTDYSDALIPSRDSRAVARMAWSRITCDLVQTRYTPRQCPLPALGPLWSCTIQLKVLELSGLSSLPLLDRLTKVLQGKRDLEGPYER